MKSTRGRREREIQRDMATNLNTKQFVALSSNNYCWQNQNQSVEKLMIMYDSHPLQAMRTRGIING